jgi:WD40 repeat protein
MDRLHKDYINYLEFSPDNSLIASGCLEGKIIIWDVSKW